MKFNRSMLKLVAAALLVLTAILYFAKVDMSVDMGFFALALAAWAAAE